MEVSRLFYSFMFLLSFTMPVSAQVSQSYYFHNLNINNGLSQNTVNTILQDSNGFMWFGTKDGLNRYDGISFKVFKDRSDNPNGLKQAFITTLFEDKKGHIWIGTDVGVYVYNPYTEHFEHFVAQAQNGKMIDKTVNKIVDGGANDIFFIVDGHGLFVYDTQQQKLINHPFPNKDLVRDIQLDKHGVIWISFYKGLYFTEDNFKTLKTYRLRNGEELFKEELITAFYFGASNKMYIGSEKNGMSELDLITQKVSKLALSTHPETPIFVRCLSPYSSDELWIGTETGIYIYNLKTKASTHLQNDKSDPFSISDNAIYSLCKDREGGMWIGSYFGGVNYYPRQTTYFEKYYPTNDLKTLQGQRVREICKGKGDDLWIGTEDAGLFRFNVSTKTFKHIDASSKFSNIHGLCMDGDDLWVGTFSKGVHVINTVTGRIKSYTADDSPATIQDNYVFSILKSSTGHIYLGTSLSLMKYDKVRGTFERVPELDHNLVYDIKEDSQGNLWVATYANGVFRHEAKTGKWEHFRHTEKKGSLPYDKVLSIFEDSNLQIWLTTQGKGFCKFDPASKTFLQYPTSGGTLQGVVYQIIEDDSGFFWLTTNNGLIRFRPSDGSTKTFTAASGLLNDQFNYKSSYKTEDGNILLGCISGLISFNPNTFTENEYIPPVYITDFLLFSKSAHVGGKNSPLNKSILFSDSITLKHNQNHFSLRIAALSYQAPEINSLQYKLEGIGEDWQDVTESSLISYSNLSSGQYLFRVRGANNDQLWNPKEKTLFIEVLPPFYLTVWAYLAYSIIAIIVLFLLIRFLRNRQKLKQKLFIQALEQNKEREIHEAKIRFFTNITHEIRTPLTLIKGPLENIIVKNEIRDVDTVEDLHIMKQNTDRLLNLTNQLLDFRKTEKEGFLLNLSEYNISSILTEIKQRFSPLIKEYNRVFVLEMDTDSFYAFIDREAFVKIISNLFSNAIKYAEKNIKASLITDTADDTFEVHVESDGHPISPEHHEDVFKPFTRFNHPDQMNTPGTGIGMYLARTLAELHNGSLQLVTNTDNNRFSLIIPKYQERALVLDDGNAEDFNETHIELMSNSHTILIVEDSSDMQRFIKKILPEKYNILIAPNGEVAMELLKSNFVTLVISDVMMPRMTGIELCQKIKSDINYSHVPVVLLTAKTNIQSKIEGMDVGADAYIEKPFSPEYLLANVANLINSREKLKEAFMKNPMVMSNSMINTEADKEFMNTLRDVIHRHIHNSDLKMEDIAESLNMSRASFYRKIKGLLDMKPNEYLRLERLKMAAHLIKENKYPIGEICYIVGFNSPSYFAKCFQEQFGMLPKDYR